MNKKLMKIVGTGGDNQGTYKIYMRIEQQVASLKLSKKLKKLGVEQNSYFVWSKNAKEEPCVEPFSYASSIYGKGTICSAFTVAELGDMLPSHMSHKGITFSLRCSVGKWLKGNWCVYQDGHFNETATPFIEAKSEADARAKTLIYLLENNLYAHPKNKNKI